jgi:hypothetical protein
MTPATLRSSVSQSFAELISGSNDQYQLSHLASLTWGALADGEINESEAGVLSALIEQRRPARRMSELGCSVLSKTLERACSIARPRERPRSPDRQASRERRRMLGGDGSLPDDMRRAYTEGQRAVMAIIALEFRRRGRCAFAGRADRSACGRLPDDRADDGAQSPAVQAPAGDRTAAARPEAPHDPARGDLAGVARVDFIQAAKGQGRQGPNL